MILGAEIGLIVMGIIALVKGKLTLSKTRVVYGTPARMLAIIAFLPIPLSIVGGLAIGVFYASQGKPVTPESLRVPAILMELGVLVVCIVAMYAIGWSLAGPAEPPKLPGQGDRV